MIRQIGHDILGLEVSYVYMTISSILDGKQRAHFRQATSSHHMQSTENFRSHQSEYTSLYFYDSLLGTYDQSFRSLQKY